MSRPKGYIISSFLARNIIKASDLSLEYLSRGIGHSETYLASALSRERISPQSVILLKQLYSIDLTPAIRSAEMDKEQEKNEPVEIKPTADTAHMFKVVEDFSYDRSNDADRIVAALDRLTEKVEALINALK